MSLPMGARTNVFQAVPPDLEFYPTISDITTEKDESKWSDILILEFSITLERECKLILRRLLVLRILAV